MVTHPHLPGVCAMKQLRLTPAELRHELEATISEDELLSKVIELAHEHGWLVAHFRPAQTQSGRWHTAVQADGGGFPDLVMARPTIHQTRSTPMRPARVVYAELKSATGRTSPAQRQWLHILQYCGQEVYTWKPTDLDAIEEALR